jgi:CBS domain-containing protein
MSTGRICTRVVYTAAPDETVRAAAARMDQKGVGTLVVLDPARRLVGIVTDRDVAARCVGRGLDPDAALVSMVMSAPVSSVHPDTPIETALRMMAGARIRRCPVVDSEGALVGLLSLDDVLDLLAEEVEAVGALVRVQAPK